MSRGQDTRHHENRQVGKDAYPQTAVGGGGKKPPKKPRTTFGESKPDPYGDWSKHINSDYPNQPPHYRADKWSDIEGY